MKLRRILAWIIDWNLCGIPAIIYAFIFKTITEAHGLKIVYALIFVLFILSYPVLFVFRDVLFKGSSFVSLSITRSLKMRLATLLPLKRTSRTTKSTG